MDGPLVVICALTMTTGGKASHATCMAGGSTLTAMPVTTISGGFTTGSDSTFPTVSVTLAASQQEVAGLLGFLTYHQDESRFLPIISACRPAFNSPSPP